jgi:hypothetical protein
MQAILATKQNFSRLMRLSFAIRTSKITNINFHVLDKKYEEIYAVFKYPLRYMPLALSKSSLLSLFKVGVSSNQSRPAYHRDGRTLKCQCHCQHVAKNG